MRYTPKLQGGGFATFTPYIPSTPMGLGARGKASTQETPASSSILDDKIFEKLIGEGLKNDVNSFVEELIALENTDTLPYLQNSNRSSALRASAKVNELIRNKKYWEDAVQRADKEGGLNEVAIGTSGEVFTKDSKGKVQSLSLETYKKEPTQLLTVAELMNERQYNPQLVGQNQLFNVADNAVGMPRITKHISDLISAFGTETENSTRFYSKEQITSDRAKRMEQISGRKPTIAEAESLRVLSELANTPGDYISKTSEQSTERRYIDQAINYIWDTLGDKAQVKLKTMAVINGSGSPKDLIKVMAFQGSNESSKTEIVPKELPGASAAETARGTKSLTAFQLFHKDKLATPNTVFAFNDPKFGILFKGAIGGVSPLMTPDGNSIPMSTMNAILASGYNQIVKPDQVYFGQIKVSQADLNNIIYDGADAAKVYMPVGKDGAPDYAEFENFKEVYAVYEANKEKWSASDATKYFKSKSYNLIIEDQFENGKMEKVIRDNAMVKPFLVMYGYTNDATPLIQGNENWLTKLTKQEEGIIPMLKQVWTVGKGKEVQDLTPDESFNREDYYKGLIATPYRPGYAAIVDTMVDQGPLDKVSTIQTNRGNLMNSNQPATGNSSSVVLK